MNYPHPDTPFARAMWCVEHHRLHELQVEGLMAEERAAVRAVLTRQLVHARTRQVKNRVMEAILVVAFVVLGVFLMMVGPLEMIGGERGLMIYSKALLYGLLLMFVVITIAGADHMRRRRNTRARGIARAINDLQAALAQIDAVS